MAPVTLKNWICIWEHLDFKRPVSPFHQLFSIVNKVLSVTISYLFILQRIPWFYLFLPILLNVVCGFSFFCCSKTFLNAVSLPPIHPTYHNSQTNLFKALHSPLHKHFQWFYFVKYKIPQSNCRGSLKSSPVLTRPFSLFPSTKPSSGQPRDFLWAPREPALWSLHPTSVLWWGGSPDLGALSTSYRVS